MCLDKVNKNNLHIGCWNINGHKHKGFDKYSDQTFINEIKENDIICLMETHCSLENLLMLDGFRSVHLIRPKSKGTNKRSGGTCISVFVKTQPRTGVKFLEHQNNNYIWLKLCKSFFGLKDDIYICFIYNPQSTPHTRENFKMIFLSLLRKIYLNTQMTGK
jgi:exonuclease III